MPYVNEGPLVDLAFRASEDMVYDSVGAEIFLVPKVDGGAPDTATIETYRGEEVIFQTGTVPTVEEDEDEATVELSTRQFHLAAVDFSGLIEANAHALVGLLSFVYVGGRLDQIADEEGSNAERMVRARHLGRVLEFLQVEVPIGDEDAKVILDNFTKLRGSRKDQPEA